MCSEVISMIIEESGGATVSLSPEMTAQLEEAALEEGWTKSELLHEALRKYLSDRRWYRILRESQEIAKEHGIAPDDVERLIDEHREEVRRANPGSS